MIDNPLVSNCCGSPDQTNQSGISYSDVGYCPKCGEWCKYIAEEDYETKTLDNE